MDDLEERVQKLQSASNPKTINRFHTMLALIHELGLTEGDVRQTRYFKNRTELEQEIAVQSIKGGYSQLKSGLLVAAKRNPRRNPSKAGIDYGITMMAYAQALQANPRADLDKVRIKEPRFKHGHQRSHYRIAAGLREQIKPLIHTMQTGDMIAGDMNYSLASLGLTPRQVSALQAYSNIIWGVKELSTLERDALALLPNSRPPAAFTDKLRHTLSEPERKHMIYARLKAAYGR